MAKPLLVGMNNPYGADPRYALFPYPERSAGGRLCREVMQLSANRYLNSFQRVNLCTGAWSLKAARARATELMATRDPTQSFVLLGEKVCCAFDVPFEPYSVQWLDGTEEGGAVVVLPHPSGLNRMWNEPGAFDRARRILMEAKVLNSDVET